MCQKPAEGLEFWDLGFKVAGVAQHVRSDLVHIDVSAALAGREAADCCTALSQPQTRVAPELRSFCAPVLLHTPDVRALPSIPPLPPNAV